jgi:hypothetical protein
MIPYEKLSEKTQQILVRKSRSNGRLPAECLDIFEGQILYLVDAINALPGLVSNESCGGHAEKLRLPFVKFTLLEPAAAQRDLAYVVKGAYLSHWQVLCSCSRPGSAEGIYYSYLLMPRLGHASDTAILTFDAPAVFNPYQNKAVSAVAVEASQSSIMMVGEQIRRLSALSVPAGCSEARLFI